jgi:hypothetical protein
VAFADHESRVITETHLVYLHLIGAHDCLHTN